MNRAYIQKLPEQYGRLFRQNLVAITGSVRRDAWDSLLHVSVYTSLDMTPPAYDGSVSSGLPPDCSSDSVVLAPVSP